MAAVVVVVLVELVLLQFQHNKMSEKLIKRILKNASIARQVCIQYDDVYVQSFLREVQRFNTEPMYEIFQQVYVRYAALLNRTGLLLIRTLEFQTDSKRRSEYANYTTVLFELAYTATHLLREVYELAYKRDLIDSMVRNLFQARVSSVDTSCELSSVYVETATLDRLGEICAAADGGIEKADFCNHLVYFRNSKDRIDAAASNRKLDKVLLEGYINVWLAFQSRLINLIFRNFINFYNENLVKCMIVFIDQQTQIRLQYIDMIQKMQYDGMKKANVKIQW